MASMWLAAFALAFAGCSESDGDNIPEGGGSPIDPPTIEFAQQIQIDETGEWPVAKVAVTVSQNAENWFWKFDESTRGYQDWTMLEPSRSSIEFPVLYTGTYTLSVYAKNAGGQSQVKTADFNVTIPEKFGDVFAAIDWHLNADKTEVEFTISTTDATEQWYYEFVPAEEATAFDGQNIPDTFTEGDETTFSLPFELNTEYKMTVIAVNGGGKRATSATVSYEASEGGAEAEALAAVKFTISDDKDEITFTVTTTKATEAWYYEFAAADEATELPETITEIPDTFEEGTEATFTLPYEVNTAYVMSVIAQAGDNYTATVLEITTDWALPVMEILGANFSYADDTYRATLKPSQATTKYYYYWGPIDYSVDGGSATDPYAIEEIFAYIEEQDVDKLIEIGFIEVEGNESDDLEYVAGPYQGTTYNKEFTYGHSLTYTPYGLVAVAVNAAGWSEPKYEWPVAPAPTFYTEPTVTVTGPWTVNVNYSMGNGLQRFVIGAITTNTTEIPQSGGAETQPYDETKFIDAAQLSIEASGRQDGYSIQTYAVVSTSGVEISELNLYRNTPSTQDPAGLRLIPNTEYTVAIYGVTADNESFVKTYNFTSLPFATSADAAVKPTVSVTENGSNSASVHIEAAGAHRIFYGYKDVSTFSDTDLYNAYVTSEGTFSTYEGPIDFDFRKVDPSATYVAYAAAIDSNGKISQAVYEKIESEEVKHDSAAKINSVQATLFTPQDADHLQSGYLKLKIDMNEQVAKVKILAVHTSSIDGNPTLSLLDSWFTNEQGVVTTYDRSEVESDDFAIWYSQANEAHWFYLMPVDADGNFGVYTNLGFTTASMTDGSMWSRSFTYSGPREEVGSDNGYFTQEFKGNYLDYLKVEFDGNVASDSNDITISLPTTTPDGYESVTKIIVFSGTADSDSPADIAKEAKDILELYNYPNLSGFAWNLSQIHNGPIADFTQPKTKVFFGSWNAQWASEGCPFVVTVVVGENDNATIKTAAYLVEGDANVHYVDLTDAL